MEHNAQIKKRRKLSLGKYLYVCIPHMIMIPFTILFTRHALESHLLVTLFDIKIPNEITFEYKLSLICKMGSLISLFLFVNLIMVMGSRIVTVAVDPLKDDGNNLVNTCNKIFKNMIEQTIIFSFLLSNWFINSSNSETEVKQGISLFIIWAVGRIIFLITYPLGIWMNYSTLRVFGFVPTLHPTSLLIQKILNINVI
jgi:hypothetical protein